MKYLLPLVLVFAGLSSRAQSPVNPSCYVDLGTEVFTVLARWVNVRPKAGDIGKVIVRGFGKGVEFNPARPHAPRVQYRDIRTWDDALWSNPYLVGEIARDLGIGGRGMARRILRSHYARNSLPTSCANLH